VTPQLRQVCLVAPALAPLADDLAAIFGLVPCYSDPHVRRYGLENILFPLGTTLIEIVAPVEAGTAAGRFLERTGGRGGYMAIFACDDPDALGAAAEARGVRTAHVIDHPPYHGVQLHPRDCRAGFIEFNHVAGETSLDGVYPPAGPGWQRCVRTDVSRRVVAVQLQSPTPASLAAHWAALLGIGIADGAVSIPLPNARIDVATGPAEAITGLVIEVVAPDAVRAAATARGYPLHDGMVSLAGIDWHLQAAP
jgi:hypothetical protein